MDYLESIYDQASRMDENMQRKLYKIAKRLGKEHRRPRVDPDEADDLSALPHCGRR